MKTIITSLILACSLVGCSKYIGQHTLNKALSICKDREGVFEILISPSGNAFVTCKNAYKEAVGSIDIKL